MTVLLLKTEGNQRSHKVQSDLKRKSYNYENREKGLKLKLYWSNFTKVQVEEVIIFIQIFFYFLQSLK